MATAAKPPGPSAVRRRRKLCFALLPLAALLLLAEVGLRLARSRQGRGSFWSASFREQRLALVRASYPVAPDPQLGYVPRPNAVSSANRWGALVSIDAHGLRQPGQQPSRTDCVGVLAVGDSFTFGDQVSDGDTWPAQLEQRLQVPVWNAGVFGYSFAQAVLRAELLLPRLPVGALVVSFIADDLRRCELSQRGPCRRAAGPAGVAALLRRPHDAGWQCLGRHEVGCLAATDRASPRAAALIPVAGRSRHGSIAAGPTAEEPCRTNWK
jgi:hypothetical protein